MKIINDVIILRELLNMSQEELAKELNVGFETINRWENSKNEIENYNLERIYTYAYKNKIYLNLITEQFLKEQENKSFKILFHGCKKDMTFPIDLKHSKVNNDFGIGFYLGENLKQAATYISNSDSSDIYAFSLNVSDLKIKEFNVSKEWMITIAYYRGWLNKYEQCDYLRNIIGEVEKYDIIIAPIADNKMFDIVSEFVRGEITDEQCQHALAATNLGMQYVIRNSNVLKKLELIKKCYLSVEEKKQYTKERLQLSDVCQDKVKIARIEYRGKGHYVDELLK